MSNSTTPFAAPDGSISADIGAIGGFFVPGAVLADLFKRGHMEILIAGFITSVMGYAVTQYRVDKKAAPLYMSTPLLGFGMGYVRCRMDPLKPMPALVGGLVGAAVAYGLFPPNKSTASRREFTSQGAAVTEDVYYRIKPNLTGFGASPAATFDYPYNKSEEAFDRTYA